MEGGEKEGRGGGGISLIPSTAPCEKGLSLTSLGNRYLITTAQYTALVVPKSFCPELKLGQEKLYCVTSLDLSKSMSLIHHP